MGKSKYMKTVKKAFKMPEDGAMHIGRGGWGDAGPCPVQGHGAKPQLGKDAGAAASKRQGAAVLDGIFGTPGGPKKGLPDALAEAEANMGGITDAFESPESAYVFYFVLLAAIQMSVKDEEKLRRRMRKVLAHYEASTGEGWFARKLASLAESAQGPDKGEGTGNVPERDAVIASLAKSEYDEALADALKAEDERLRKELEASWKAEEEAKAEAAKMAAEAKAARERYEALRAERNKEVGRLSKQVLSLEHKLDEMEKLNQELMLKS